MNLNNKVDVEEILDKVLKLLDDALIDRIVDEARGLLRTIGVEIHNEAVLSMLGDHGAEQHFDNRSGFGDPDAGEHFGEPPQYRLGGQETARIVRGSNQVR